MKYVEEILGIENTTVSPVHSVVHGVVHSVVHGIVHGVVHGVMVSIRGLSCSIVI